MPRKPYRSPRDWLDTAQSSRFGHGATAGLKWLDAGTPREAALLAAAKKQNDLVFLIRLNFKYDKATTALAGFADLHPDTVRDILNGSKHATLTVLYVFAGGLGLELTVSTTEAIDPSPEEDHRGTPAETSTDAAG